MVRTLVALPDGTLEPHDLVAAERLAPTIVDLAPAIGWDEREAHDRDGIRFAGHAPLRPLLDHPADPAVWTIPVDGDDAYDVAVGPIHAGVIESGHFRFHVVGERILLVDARLFHKHRGLERLAEGRSPDDALPVVERACAACSVSNALAYCRACEDALGVTAGPALAACAICCSSWSGRGATSTTSRPSAPASASLLATSSSPR